MTAEHLALIWAADHLSPSEKNLLLACGNLCTQKGTFSAGMERLTRMTGMSARNVIRTRKLLADRGLMKARRRNNGGESLKNAYWINAAALAELCPAEPREYDDDAFAAMFGLDEETASDQQICQIGTSGLTASDQQICQPGVSAGQDSGTGDQQICQIGTSGLTASDQQICQPDTHKEEEVIKLLPLTPSIEDGRAFVAELPASVLSRLSELHRARLAKLAAVALAAGHDRATLRRFVTVDMDGVRSLYAVMSKRLREDLPSEPLAPMQPARSQRAEAAAPKKPIAAASQAAFTEPGISFIPTRLKSAPQGDTDASGRGSATTSLAG